MFLRKYILLVTFHLQEKNMKTAKGKERETEIQRRAISVIIKSWCKDFWMSNSTTE